MSVDVRTEKYLHSLYLWRMEQDRLDFDLGGCDENAIITFTGGRYDRKAPDSLWDEAEAAKLRPIKRYRPIDGVLTLMEKKGV